MNKFKKDFPIFKNNKKLIYLDSAATSQKPKAVLDSIRRYYENYNSNIRRGLYPIAEKATQKVEEIRKKTARFIGVSPNEIIFVRNTTEGINLIAKSFMSYNIKKGEAIACTIMEHHSNFVPWQQLCIQEKLNFVVLDFDENFNLLIDCVDFKKIQFLAIAHVSNVLGVINPIGEIIRKIKKQNPKIKILVDAAQSVPHLKIDVRKIDCDFLVFSGHKMMAGTGIGVLYIKEEIQPYVKPFLYGGEMVSSVTIKKSEFLPPPFKFEAGTPDIAGIITLESAIDYIEKIGFDKIQKYEKELIEYALSELKKIKEIRIYGPTDIRKRTGVISFSIDGIHPHDIAQILGDQNICIRAGNHCAMPLHKRLGVEATARISLYVYNTSEDIDKLISGINKVLKIFNQ